MNLTNRVRKLTNYHYHRIRWNVSDAAGPPSGQPVDLRLPYVRVKVGEFLHGAHCGDNQHG